MNCTFYSTGTINTPHIIVTILIMTSANTFALLVWLFGLGRCSFTLTTFLPDTEYDGQTVNAAGQAFNIGPNGPATYCPLSDQTQCPVGNETIFAGIDSLFVSVSDFLGINF